MAEEISEQSGARAFLVRVPSLLAAGALFILMVMTFCDVVLRSVANNPIESATELTRLLMAITVFSALPVISWRGEHIVVDLLDPLFNKKAARWRNVLVDLVSGACLIWPAIRVWQLALRAAEYGDTTEYLQIPQTYIASFIALATFCTCIVLLLRGLLGIFAPARLPVQDHQLPVD